MTDFRRVLISNRGEIAIRIAKAASALGIESVGVYPLADSLSLHTRMVSDVRKIGDGAAGDPVQAYLNCEELLRVARETGCDCVHPGYGFLAENAGFAEGCAAQGLSFIGPSSATLALFGDKIRARALAESLGIPVVPGTPTPLGTAAAARAAADSIGYPVMLKAAAGGGGRGMRSVTGSAGIAEAYERCRSEALAAFGDDTLFLEKIIERPRHIEVQVLADAAGKAIHLHERDCSIQQRHQKVVEIAPAPGLDTALRERLFADSIKLVQAAGLTNAATVEFLVSPETGRHYFIECNPRLQVEHTVTEQISDVDLVEAQFRIAGGKSLASLGLGDQSAVGAPRGFAVQARVVARGAGSLNGYKEPSGPGVRVDACGYLGYAPPPQFDPLLAKVIGWSLTRGTSTAGMAHFEAALDRTCRALGEFHIGGLATNVTLLQAILADPVVRAGDARTTFLDDSSARPGPQSPTGSPALALLRQQALLAGVSEGIPAVSAPARTAVSALLVGSGQQGVTSSMGGSVSEVRVREGDRVATGEVLLVVSAMKMESLVAAPCAGVLATLQPLEIGDSVEAGQVVAVITPDEGSAVGVAGIGDEDTWAPQLREVAAMQELADRRLAPGSSDPGVVRQRTRGKLTCRERIDLLLDEGTFREVGSVAGFASYDEDGTITDFTPANHVGGLGKIEGRSAVVCADDFTSRGGHADGAIAAKSRHLDALSVQLRVPSVRLLDGSSGGGSVAAMVPAQKREGESRAKESAGAIEAGRPRVASEGGSFLPGHLGSTLYTDQLATVPVVNMLLGSVVGIGAAKAVLGHFSVMVRDIAQLFVAGPPVVRHAMGYDITKEDLGGWHIHCRNGSVDNLADTEEEACAHVRRFLSYLPANTYETPPVRTLGRGDSPDRRVDELFALIPRKRTATFDVRKAIRLMADRDSFFEIGPLWGTDQVTGFVRFNGHPMGVIASDSQHVNGGALTADGCSKLTRHIDLCDLFHLPILNLVDNPGFAVGLEHEIKGAIRRGGEWMVAFAQVTVPVFTVIMRRSFGVAGNNYATPSAHPSIRVAWPAADAGGIPPEGGIEAAYRRQLAEAADPVAFRDELMARIESVRGPIGPLSKFQMEEMIDPRDTRRLICEWIETAWRVLSHPGRLGPRALQFRP